MLNVCTALLLQWASYVRNVVRNSKGLPVIIALLEANHDPVIRAATTALRNLAIDPRNKAIIGMYVCILTFCILNTFEYVLVNTDTMGPIIKVF